MIKISNICLHRNSIKENMFTINLEDGREAPSKDSLIIRENCLTLTKYLYSVDIFVFLSIQKIY